MPSMCNFRLDLGFYALPAKEELSPMFPHNSSSHEISTETNAFVQNSMVGSLMLSLYSIPFHQNWNDPF